MLDNLKGDYVRQAKEFVAQSSHDQQLNTSNKLRLKALCAFEKLGMPTTHHEDWKYTDLKHLINRKFFLTPDLTTGLTPSLSDNSVKYNPAFIDLLKIKIAKLTENNPDSLTCLLMLDGEFVRDLSVFSDKISNNIISIKDGHNEDSDIGEHDAIAQFVNATWQDGIKINLNNTIKNEVIILNIHTEHSNNRIINSKHECCLFNNTELDLKEVYVLASNEKAAIDDFFYENINNNFNNNSENIASAFNSNILFNIKLFDNSKCHHYILNNHGADSYNISSYYVTQNKDSEYNNYNFNFGGKVSRQDIIVKQNDSNATTKLHGLFVPRNTQHMDTHLKIFHQSSHGNSLQDYVGVLLDRGQGVLNNLVYVAENIKNITAIQKNKNLLLSKNAQVNTKPELQIHAKDVYCAHGATIGRLDETAMFYLRSRGISQRDAKKILIQAFVNELIGEIKDNKDNNIINWLECILTQRLSVID